MQRVFLGKTGIEVSKLCLGTGTVGGNHTSRQTRSLGLKGLADLIVYAYEKGITFIDTADAYGSHPHIREALRRIPREHVAIATKTVAKTANQMKADLDRFRQELGVDYLDIVLLHCMMNPDWNIQRRSVMDVLSEAKARGVVQAVGCSNHEYGALCTAAQEPWVDVVLVRLNSQGILMEGEPSDIISVILQMQANGKGTYGMKVMGEGQLRHDPKSAIQYQLKAPVDAFVIGMESRAEVDENVRLVEKLTLLQTKAAVD
ncbi:MAG: aldo/keto reductase [Leptolyngbyaceae cyanobacterium MO_188.B28]|nr:aldo/keto reductase [Leptolyngbyaceae cyanobacterium MO_188.B28]